MSDEVDPYEMADTLIDRTWGACTEKEKAALAEAIYVHHCRRAGLEPIYPVPRVYMTRAHSLHSRRRYASRNRSGLQFIERDKRFKSCQTEIECLNWTACQHGICLRHDVEDRGSGYVVFSIVPSTKWARVCDTLEEACHAVVAQAKRGIPCSIRKRR